MYRLRSWWILLPLLLAACGSGRRANITTDQMTVGNDGITVRDGGIDVHGVGVDFRTEALAKAGQLRVWRKDVVVHEASAKPVGRKLRFDDFRVDGVTPGVMNEPGHLNEVKVEVQLAAGERYAWTLNDADLARR